MGYPRLVKRVAFAVALLVLAGCKDDPIVTVQVCGNVSVPAEVDAVRVSLRDSSYEVVLDGVQEFIQCPAGLVGGLPTSTAFSGQSGDRYIVAEALKDGIVRASVATRLQFPPDDDLTVTLRLTVDCLGKTCPLGQTCLDGDCKVVPYHMSEPQSCPTSGGIFEPGGADVAQPEDVGTVTGDGGDAAEPPNPYCPPTATPGG